MKNLNKPFYLQSVFLLKTFSYVFLLAALYYSALQWLVFKDWVKDDYSHCMLIPLIVGYLIWEKHRLLDRSTSKPDFKGFYLFFLGIGLFWIGELAGEYFTSYFSLWMIVFSLCFINMGWQKTKIILFPLLFSLTMFPFPNFINNKLTFQLKLISSKIGVLMMQVLGMSAYREGNVIDLGFTQLQVVDACSGLRYLFPMIVLSILITYFYHGKLWKKIFLVASSIPWTIFSNSLRIALTGILSEKFGSAVIEGFFHDFEGWLIFMFTLVVLLAEIWILNRIFPEPSARENEGNETLKYEEKEKVGAHPGKGFILSTVFLGITLLMSYGIEFREAIPIAKPFDQFPMGIGNWVGARQFMEERFITELDLSDYIMADYRTDSGKDVNFYVAYYETQRKGESIHSPASCLQGSGWVFQQAGKTDVDLDNAGKMPVNRALIEKKPFRQLSYYWFPCRGRILTNVYELKIYNFWDALTRQRTDGALVRLITQIYPDEEVADAEKRIRQFTRDVVPVLNQFLPGE